ncbi:hypothetical protein D9M71_840530 [compost metagenome]
MVADPQHRLVRHLAKHPDLEGQGVAQLAHEQLRPALTAFGRGWNMQAFIQAEQCRHTQAEQHHQHYPQDACEDAQAPHQTAALKWRA